MKKPQPVEFKHNKIMLVEGLDEQKFFVSLLEKIGINDIQIIEHGGKENFKKFLPVLINNPGFDSIKTIVVIRDADNSVAAALQSIQHCLSKNSLPSPKENSSFIESGLMKVGVFILPGDQDFGMLESLVLNSIANCDVIDESNAYIDRLIHKFTESQKIDQIPANQFKARMHAYFAGKPKYVPNIGIAAEKGYIDFSSTVFDPLKNFLRLV